MGVRDIRQAAQAQAAMLCCGLNTFMPPAIKVVCGISFASAVLGRRRRQRIVRI